MNRLDRDLFKKLLNLGAKPTLCDETGRTPLHIAAWGDKDGFFVSRLIQAGAFVNQQAITEPDGDSYITPLDLAIADGNFTAAEMLIQAGARISRNNAINLQALVKPLLLEGKISPAQLKAAEDNLQLAITGSEYDA